MPPPEKPGSEKVLLQRLMNKVVGDKLRQMREASGKSVADIAQASGIADPNELEQIEAGERHAGSQIFDIIAALGGDVETFFSQTKTPTGTEPRTPAAEEGGMRNLELEARYRVSINLKGFRARRRMSREKLAKELGITLDELVSYESGSVKIPEDKLTAAADILEVKLADFFLEIGDPNNPSRGGSGAPKFPLKR